MKDENNDEIMTEFVDLEQRCTLYASAVRRTQKKSKVSRVTL